MDKGILKIKKIVIILLVVTVVLYGFVNIFIYTSGHAFAKQYGASRIVIDYHYVTTRDAGPQPKFPGRMSPSFFYFYAEDEKGNEYDLVYYKLLSDEYEALNIKNDSLYEGLKLMVTVVSLISFGAGCYALFKRVHSAGFFIGSLLSVSIFFGLGMLNYYAYVVALGLLFSTFLVIRAHFIDYNQSRIPFIKKKKYN